MDMQPVITYELGMEPVGKEIERTETNHPELTPKISIFIDIITFIFLVLVLWMIIGRILCKKMNWNRKMDDEKSSREKQESYLMSQPIANMSATISEGKS